MFKSEDLLFFRLYITKLFSQICCWKKININSLPTSLLFPGIVFGVSLGSRIPIWKSFSCLLISLTSLYSWISILKPLMRFICLLNSNSSVQQEIINLSLTSFREGFNHKLYFHLVPQLYIYIEYIIYEKVRFQFIAICLFNIIISRLILIPKRSFTDDNKTKIDFWKDNTEYLVEIYIISWSNDWIKKLN